MTVVFLVDYFTRLPQVKAEFSLFFQDSDMVFIYIFVDPKEPPLSGQIHVRFSN
jgi:hypothetical protein